MSRHALEIELDQATKKLQEHQIHITELTNKLRNAKDECYIVTYFTAFQERKVFENFMAFTKEQADGFCDNFDANLAQRNYHRTQIYYDLHLIEKVVHDMDRAKWTSNSLALIGNPTYARIKFKGEDA